MADVSPLKKLLELGQSPWLDFIGRSLIESGELGRMIEQHGLRGMTSNPVIFHKAITDTQEYDADIAALARAGSTADEIYERLVTDEVRAAADVFRPVYDETQGADGFVSLEVSPHLARDADGTVAEAHRLFGIVARPNVMIKVPGTVEGLDAIRRLLADGVNVNVTLLFSVARYRDVLEAHTAGLEAAAAANRPLERIASVASFFLSRIDTLVDRELDRLAAAGGARAREAAALRGAIAIASARSAYVEFRAWISAPRFERLAARGARVQRPLWASTGTKDPAYEDTKYVEALIGPDTINTMPLGAFEAYADHGRPAPRLTAEADAAEQALAALAALGLDLEVFTAQLVEEGIDKFVEPFDALLGALAEQRGALR